jgi:hypothetical protein
MVMIDPDPVDAIVVSVVPPPEVSTRDSEPDDVDESDPPQATTAPEAATVRSVTAKNLRNENIDAFQQRISNASHQAHQLVTQ